MTPDLAAQAVLDGYDRFEGGFARVTARAGAHFAARDWRRAKRDDRERQLLYERAVREVVLALRNGLGEAVRRQGTWAAMRAAYAARLAGHAAPELAETFYNSVTRRVFDTVGVNEEIEFVRLAPPCAELAEDDPPFRVYAAAAGSTAGLVARILAGYQLGVPFQDTHRDARRVAERAEAVLAEHGATLRRVEMVEAAFFRNKGTYLIGRLCAEGPGGEPLTLPLVIAVVHAPVNHPLGPGLRVDAALLRAAEASQVFSFTRSYFHVCCDSARELVHFLSTLMPHKRIAELYIALGHVKHGKTELYRDFRRHLAAHPGEQFEPARGTRGMVMAVFTLPSYDFVFKLIKDRFDPPKQTTRAEVEAQYRFVRLNDRVGRLADVQEFEHLALDRARFSDDLLAYLREAAPSIVHARGDALTIDHLYTERRVTPLNLYLQEADAEAGAAAVHDLAQAIRDLAAAGFFPGDMLIKNFGVTRHGRVIFYDYDELGRVQDYAFRALPQARTEHEAMAAEPWYYVGPRDIFPEEIATFLGLPARYREVFVREHGDLLTVEWWRSMQAWHDEDEPPDLFPYRQDQRFPLDV